jgi:hypothetical protein
LTHSGGVDVGLSTSEITIMGNRRNPVEIVDMYPVLDGACTPPLSGIFEPHQAQGESEKIVLYTAVDRPSPRMLLADPGTTRNPDAFFAHHKITLPKGERT